MKHIALAIASLASLSTQSFSQDQFSSLTNDLGLLETIPGCSSRPFVDILLSPDGMLYTLDDAQSFSSSNVASVYSFTTDSAGIRRLNEQPIACEIANTAGQNVGNRSILAAGYDRMVIRMIGLLGAPDRIICLHIGGATSGAIMDLRFSATFDTSPQTTPTVTPSGAFGASATVFQIEGRTYVAVGDPEATNDAVLPPPFTIPPYEDGALWVIDVTDPTSTIGTTSPSTRLSLPPITFPATPTTTAMLVSNSEFGISVASGEINGTAYLAGGAPNRTNAFPTPPELGWVQDYTLELVDFPFSQNVINVMSTGEVLPTTAVRFGETVAVSGNWLSVGSTTEGDLMVSRDGQGPDPDALPRPLGLDSYEMLGVNSLSGGFPDYVGLVNGDIVTGSWDPVASSWIQYPGPSMESTSPGDNFSIDFTRDGLAVVQDGTGSGVDGRYILQQADGPIRLNEAFAPQGGAYCPSEPNSTGVPGEVAAIGSPLLTQNVVTLEASNLPPLAFTLFLTSDTPGFVANPGGAIGNLCLGGSIGRYTGPGQVGNATSAGTYTLAIDLTTLPMQGGFMSAQVGSTQHFQAWHRDAIGGQGTQAFSLPARFLVQ